VTSFAIEFTEFLAVWWPFATLTALALVLGTGAVFLLRVPLAKRNWVKFCTRLTGVFLVLPTTAAFLLLIGMSACASRPRIFVSPDSSYIAEYRYDAGFLGRDSTLVTVRKRWAFSEHTVYEYEGPSNWAGTEVRWLGNNRLLVEYHPDPHRFQECKTAVATITVRCVAVTR
jgi:hypothetical protein